MSGKNNDGDEHVGYKRPPKCNRFRKNQSGNPQGRPKKTRLTADIESIFNQIFDLAINGERIKATLTEALVWQMSALALKGDRKASRAMSKFVQKASLAQATPPPRRITHIRNIVMTTSLSLSTLGALRNVSNRWLIESWILEEALAHKPDALATIDPDVLAEWVVDKKFLAQLILGRAA